MSLVVFALSFLVLAVSVSASEFLWPTRGGSSTNQQRTPDTTNVYVNQGNIGSIAAKCKYASADSAAMYGYASVYKDDNGDYNAVFADFSGHITNVNLDTCVENWRTYITHALNEDPLAPYVTRNGVSLFTNAAGIDGVLFGTPNAAMTAFQMKYAVALYLETGELMWKLALNDTALEAYGAVHAFAVDDRGRYAYGGMAAGCQDLDHAADCMFVGRLIKIDLELPAVVDVWYTIAAAQQPAPGAQPFDRDYFQGAGVWNWPALIGDYVVFGSGNLYSVPLRIQDCMRGDATQIPPNAAPVDPCGVDQSADHVQWQCLPGDVFPDAFTVLQTRTNVLNERMQHIRSVPLQGLDPFFSGPDAACNLGLSPYGVPWNDTLCYAMALSGADTDLAAVAAYAHEDSLYAAAVAKSGMFYVFGVPSAELILAKKIGPWSELGGGHFGLAVDADAMIAVAHITGGTGIYYTVLADNIAYCGGSVHAISLVDGKTLYQIPNPWALSGAECTAQTILEVPLTHYVDYSIKNSGLCEKGDFADEDTTVIHIDTSALVAEVTPNAAQRATFFGPVTIANDLLFIPSSTGDIFIHNLLTGEYIHTLRCDYVEIVLDIYGRRGTRAGVTVVEDRVIYYCGDWSNSALLMGQSFLHSYQLP